MKDKIFEKMQEYGWNLGDNTNEDFNRVYDYHYGNLDKWYNYISGEDKEVCDYITSHNGVSDNLYNGILLEVYEEYAYNYLENETNEENHGNKMTLQDLEEIADDIINNEYFGEILTDIIRTTTTNFLGE